jgi:hypothetical protein
MKHETTESEGGSGNQNRDGAKDKTTSPIDYKRLGEEVEVARRRAEVSRQSAEASGIAALVGMTISGILAGLVAHRWWVGLAAALSPFFRFVIPRMRWCFALGGAGLCTYLMWMFMASAWSTGPVVSRVCFSIVAGVGIGALGYSLVIPRLRTALTFGFAGLAAYLTWMVIRAAWPAVPVVAGVAISVVAAGIGALAYAGMVGEWGRAIGESEDRCE